MQKGFFEICVYHIKNELNIGTLWRSAYQLGASGIFTIGKRYKKQVSDTCKATRHIPLRHYLDIDEMLNNKPIGARLIGAEMGGQVLSTFKHPQQAIYLLGAEKNGLTALKKWEYSHLEVLDKLGLDSWQMCSEYYRNADNERVVTMMRELKDGK